MIFSLLIFGQFRHASICFENNIIELLKITKENKINVYILTEKEFNFQSNKIFIKNILDKYNICLKYYGYMDEYPEDLEIENQIQKDYNEKVLNLVKCNQKGYNSFVAKLWYRRYLLYSIYQSKKEENSDYILWGRFFDIDFKLLKDFDFIGKDFDKLYYSHDTFFLGSESTIDKLSLFAKNLATNLVYEDIWQNQEFCKEFNKNDYCLFGCKPTFSSEVQVCYYIFKNIPNNLNIRFDFSNPNLDIKNTDSLLYARIKR
jgi:hypothetical protein